MFFINDGLAVFSRHVRPPRGCAATLSLAAWSAPDDGDIVILRDVFMAINVLVIAAGHVALVVSFIARLI
jgi:hypothetical protein